VSKYPSLILSLCLCGSAVGAAQSSQTQGPEYRVSSEIVTVPVVVIDREGRVYTKLPKQAFTLFEDGRQQEITTFLRGEDAPLVLILLVEYSNLTGYLRDDVLQPAGIFISRVMRPNDYVSMITYDLTPHVITDFTKSRAKLIDGLNNLLSGYPNFSEVSLYDAVKFALVGGVLGDTEYQGIAKVNGRTAILLISTGIDTFSKITLSQALRIVDDSGVPIYTLGVGQMAYILAEPYLSGLQQITFLQAENTLRSFSEDSGGRYYGVRFSTEVNDDLTQLATMLHFQYTLGYRPKPGEPGKKRRLELKVDVDGDGKPDNDRLNLQYRRYYIEPKAGSQ
jgi:Ca-activated chloride channel family protein